jgi:membrane-associated protein
VDTAEKSRALAESVGSLLNPKDLIQSLGLVGVWIIIFAETGLLIGFFFPGDSLIFMAGVASSPVAQEFVGTRLPLVPLLIVTPIVAILGAQLGHFLGARYGRRMFQRPDSRLFKQEYVQKAETFFNRFGPAKAIILSRFTPVVRTFMNPIAGVLEVPARTFLLWNAVVSIIWADGVLLIGYALAKQILRVIPASKIDTYLLPVIVVIVLISLIPIFVEYLRGRRAKARGQAEPSDAAAAHTTGQVARQGTSGPAVGRAEVRPWPPTEGQGGGRRSPR